VIQAVLIRSKNDRENQKSSHSERVKALSHTYILRCIIVQLQCYTFRHTYSAPSSETTAVTNKRYRVN